MWPLFFPHCQQGALSHIMRLWSTASADSAHLVLDIDSVGDERELEVALACPERVVDHLFLWLLPSSRCTLPHLLGVSCAAG